MANRIISATKYNNALKSIYRTSNGDGKVSEISAKEGELLNPNIIIDKDLLSKYTFLINSNYYSSFPEKPKTGSKVMEEAFDRINQIYSDIGSIKPCSSCTGYCASACTNNCGSTCNVGCSGGCNNLCISGCTGHCLGCSNCYGPAGPCIACWICSGNCQGCGGGCSGGCATGCIKNCQDSCTFNCGSNCEGCGNSCDSNCSKQCKQTCVSGCSNSARIGTLKS